GGAGDPSTSSVENGPSFCARTSSVSAAPGRSKLERSCSSVPCSRRSTSIRLQLHSGRRLPNFRATGKTPPAKKHLSGTRGQQHPPQEELTRFPSGQLGAQADTSHLGPKPSPSGRRDG